MFGKKSLLIILILIFLIAFAFAIYPCSKDSDCTSGQYDHCNEEDGVCYYGAWCGYAYTDNGDMVKSCVFDMEITKEKYCNDEKDNDNDGAIDCDDSDCKGTSYCKSQSWECSFDYECENFGSNYGCINHGCTYIECYVDMDCGTYEKCQNYQCVGNSSGSCTSSVTCPYGYECENGVCVVEGKCETNNDCDEGWKCESGRCAPPLIECIDSVECDSGEICLMGKCKIYQNKTKSRNELKNKFSRNNLRPGIPPVKELTPIQKVNINLRLGLNADDYVQGMGNGKKAYIVISEEVGDYERTWIGGKINSSVDLLNYLGYSVRFIEGKTGDEVFETLADPNIGAVTYFGHGAEPSVEGRDSTSVAATISQERIKWYQNNYGMTQQEAIEQVRNESSLGLDFFYNHTCHSADPGYKELANTLIREGGVYYGEQGLLWATSHPDSEYIGGTY